MIIKIISLNNQFVIIVERKETVPLCYSSESEIRVGEYLSGLHKKPDDVNSDLIPMNNLNRDGWRYAMPSCFFMINLFEMIS